MKENLNSMPGREIHLYQTGNRPAKIDGQVEGETVRLAPRQMGELFQTSRSNVAEYIRRIPVESGLTESSAWRNFRRGIATSFAIILLICIRLLKFSAR